MNALQIIPVPGAVGLLLIAGLPALGTSGSGRPLSSFLYDKNGGLRLHSATVSSGYYSMGIGGTRLSFPNERSLGGNVLMTGSTVMAWSRLSGRSHIGITYSPAYLIDARNPDYSNWSHMLSLTANRRFSQKLELNLAMGATYSKLEQMLFAPSTFSTAASLPASFDEFANVLLSRPFTTAQLASSLTGSSIADTPGRITFFGDRILNASGALSISYSPSTRTAITLNGGYLRSQGVTPEDDNRPRGILTRSENASVSLTIARLLSPRTQAGVSWAADNTRSSLFDATRGTVSLFVGRKMGRHWFVQGTGGIGTVVRVRQIESRLPSGLQYLGGGSIGFVTRSHTLLCSADRSFGDQIGIGSGSSMNVHGSWRWQPAWRTWAVYANGSDQRFVDVPRSSNIRSWQATTGISKRLGREWTASIEYAHLNYSLSVLTGRIRSHAIQTVLMWSPGGPARNAESR